MFNAPYKNELIIIIIIENLAGSQKLFAYSGSSTTEINLADLTILAINT